MLTSFCAVDNLQHYIQSAAACCLWYTCISRHNQKQHQRVANAPQVVPLQHAMLCRSVAFTLKASRDHHDTAAEPSG